MAAEPNKAANKVSFDDQQRVSLDQPPDMFVTSATPTIVEAPPTPEDKEESKVEPEPEAAAAVVAPAAAVVAPAAVAAAEPKAEASNTGTMKRKSKKKRDEVGQSAHTPCLIIIIIS